MSFKIEPSAKQIISFKESNAKINIWEGSVRSGKTFISLWRFITELSEGPDGEYVMIARTYDSFKRNVLPELIAMIGADAKYYKGNREMNIYGKTIHVVGADDERAESKIRGPTFAGAYVDEISIIPESVFKMLISRCAMNNAKIFGTTNPDSPYHWLKKDFLSGSNTDVASWQFTLEDNPKLQKDDKEYLKRQYKGLWYQRFIEGKWVQAEGSVYDFFDEKYHIIDFAPSYTSSYIVGVDYGTTNPCAFVLIGVDTNRPPPHYWVESEYYFNSKVHQRQKTDSEYADDLKRFVKDRPIQAVYLDPSAVSFRMELQKQGLTKLYEAKNDVLDGIRFVGDLLNNGTFKICRSCKNVIQEFQSYVWDEKSGKTGIDKPKKENDHCFAAGTLVSTKQGPKPIESILPEDEVKTRNGFKKVITTFKNYDWVSVFNVLGKKIIATDAHPFLTINGWKNLSDLIQSDILFIEGEEWQSVSNFDQSSIDVIQSLKILATETILDATSPLLKKDLDISIETFGSFTLEKYHPDTIFITKMGIPTTTILAISNALVAMSISPLMGKILHLIKENGAEGMQRQLDRLQKLGIKVKKDMSGTRNTEKTLENLSLEVKCANNAKPNILPERQSTQNFVRITVEVNPEENLVLIMNKENAFFAENFILPINTKKEIFAQSLVEERHFGKRITYNLHVEKENEYFAEGILVHNCMDALRYALFTHLFGKPQSRMTPKDLDDMEREARGMDPNLPRFFQDDKFGMY